MKALFLVFWAAATAAHGAEAPPSLRASDLLPPPLLAGPSSRSTRRCGPMAI